MMKAVLLVVLLSATCVSGQSGVCKDVPPDTTFPCDYYYAIGACDANSAHHYKLEADGKLAYCLQTCGLCDQADLSVKAESKDALEEIAKQGGSFAVAEGKAVSVNQLSIDIQDEITSAIASLTKADLGMGADKQEKVVDAAIATTEAIATAVATAYSAVELRGITNSLNSQVFGLASSEAEAIANATASAYSIAIAEAGDDFTELEASTLANDVQKALTSTVIDLSISGETTASVQQEAYATAVAEAVATATAQVFASVTETENQAIALATAQAFNSSELTCFSFCNSEAPDSTMTCQEYVDTNTCSDIVGFCACACGTCRVGSEAAVYTFSEIISKSEAEQVITAMGEAFAEGAKGANAVAQAFVESVASGNAEAVTSAIAEAFGAQEITGMAITEAITQAINMGGDEMTIAVADAFSLAEAGGFVQSLAMAIADALSVSDKDDSKAKAMTQAISTAIANGNCEAISTALSEAAALAEGYGTGDAFAASLAQSEAINECFYSSDIVPAVYSTGDSYVYASSVGTAETVTQDIKELLMSEAHSAAVVMAIHGALTSGRHNAVVEAFVDLIARNETRTDIISLIAETIAKSGVAATNAIVEGLAAAEVDYSDLLSEIFVEGILGDKSKYIIQVISEAVSKYQCSVFEESLPLAYAQAEADGYGPDFVNALSEDVKKCLQLDFGIADTLKDALIKGDMDTVKEMIQKAIEDQDVDAFVEGMVLAKQENVDCDTIKKVLGLATDVTGLKAELNKFDVLSVCVSSGYNLCRGSVARECCSGGYPGECGCRRMRCRTSKNMDASLPQFGLHVYTDVGNRNCECPIVP